MFVFHLCRYAYYGCYVACYGKIKNDIAFSLRDDMLELYSLGRYPECLFQPVVFSPFVVSVPPTYQLA